MTEETPAQTEAEKAKKAKVDTSGKETALRQDAARRLGQVRSERKAAAVRENGKKGGRPPGTQTGEAAKARMREAQRRRRAREQAGTQASARASTAESGS